MHWCGDKHCRSTWPQRGWDIECPKDRIALENMDEGLRGIFLNSGLWATYPVTPDTIEWIKYRLAILALERAAGDRTGG